MVVLQPKLAQGSARPARRVRPACCAVQLSDAVCAAGEGAAVLLLGGMNDQAHEPCPGLNFLNLLEFSKADGSEIHWREKAADGSAPKSIWHHQCGSFAQGKKVVVFGGDIPERDPE